MTEPGEITKLDLGALSRFLGLKGETVDAILAADGIRLVLDISPYIIQAAGGVPAPAALPGGLEPMQQCGTGAFAVALGNNVGVLEFWGAAVVSGAAPAGRFSRVDTPPNRDYEILGIYVFLGMARGNTVEMNAILQFTSGTTADEEQLGLWAVDNHEANAMFEASRIIIFPEPYIIQANRQLYLKWQANAILAGASVDLQIHAFWKYH